MLRLLPRYSTSYDAAARLLNYFCQINSTAVALRFENSLREWTAVALADGSFIRVVRHASCPAVICQAALSAVGFEAE
jgi:hypothetical protein